jgi:hypothetical protein
MLRDKIGDCDDLTALFGSLMANLGIETMFLDVFKPGAGHIFVMFDSGIKTSKNMVSIPRFAIKEPNNAVKSSQSPILSLSISPGYFTVSKADLSSAISKKGVS